MQSRFRVKGVLLAAVLGMMASVLVASPAAAGPQPGAKPKGFRLFARALGAYTINRIYCGIASDGEICRDSTGSSTIGGGFWPKGTADQYIFNTGIQVAGIIGQDGGPWAGDTTGGFFFDPKGTTQHGSQVEPIYNFQNASDAANWPEEACVPNGDAQASLFYPLLQVDPSNAADPTCRKTASEGDIWFVSTEADPTLKAGRKHPLGIVVETRLMGWNSPSENKDIAYIIYTFYNISSVNVADYAGVRPKIRNLLLTQANNFHAAEAAQGVTLPAGGYTMTNLYVAMGTDMDVANASNNYASVNLPFALGFTYDHGMEQPGGWTFDPGIFTGPEFPGVGFAGVKYLKSPGGPGAIELYSNTINGTPFAGAFNDPQNVVQLWRYLSGNINQAAGDQACNTGNPAVTHVCFINNTAPEDMRFFESSTGLTLGPGQAGNIVVAYIFAAPVKTGTCNQNTQPCDVKPGNPLRVTSVDSLAIGANLVDSLTGYAGFTDNNGDGIPEQPEFKVVQNSLLGKALVAQQVFDTKFLRPFPPSSPDFFLVPGSNQVTVLWRPSASETGGDPYFNIASQPIVCDSLGNCQPNGLYDPNYRQFDVEGYRVYRGRVDSPNQLTLLAQFDYSGTQILDFTSQINPTSGCAPDIGVHTSCPVAFDSVGPGVAPTHSIGYPIVGDLTQVFRSPASPTGPRTILNDGSVIYQKLDTAVVGGSVFGPCAPSACPPLDDTGVPFVYVDKTALNNFRYFYSVTAFDVNSFQSGPSSLESPRLTKSITPLAPISNLASTGQVTSTQLVGRGTVIPTGVALPTIDPVKGTFSGPFPGSNAWGIGLGAFVSQVLAQPGALSASLDSVILGDAYNNVPIQYWFTASANGVSSTVSIPLLQTQEIGTTTNSTQFLAVPLDNSLASKYGGSNQYKLPGQITMNINGTDYNGLWGRGCVNGRDGYTTGGGCSYNGSRWFDGPSPAKNETQADPISCNTANFSNTPQTCYNNGGALTGVTTISQTQCYQQTGGAACRPFQGIVSGAWRAGDFNVYWGTGGKVDSVIDATTNVPVPGPKQGYANHVGASWGILNASAALSPSPDGSATLTNMDIACVEPIRTKAPGSMVCPGGTAAYVLSDSAIPGAVGFFSGGAYPPGGTGIVPATNNGFVIYLLGDVFTMELAGGTVPAQGTVWTLRKYVGAITGGHGSGGDEGNYSYSNPEGFLPFTAVGAQIQANYTVSNLLTGPTGTDLSKVHTVPDPYYVTDAYEQTTDNKVIKFVNLPTKAIIRIYSVSGILVALLEHNSTTSSEEDWNVRNRNNQVVASGVYFYHIESNDAGGTARRVGRMTIVNFAE
ncbi:MAG TPA: T9SS type A sorting domain-containing protein [Gemmatimonadales bacterium]|nr:T9SS type A sorting domain-containing protein [Gemmatimonadales bacterium]